MRGADADRRDDDAPGRRRRHAVRHVRHAIDAHCATSSRCIGLRAGRQDLRGDERIDAAEPHGVHRRHLRQRRSDRRTDRRDHACWPPRKSRRFGIVPKVALLSHSSFGSARRAVGAEDAGGAGADQRDGAGARSRRRNARRRRAVAKRCAQTLLPDSRLKGDANLLVMPNARRGEHLLQPAEDGGRQRRRRSGRSCSARRKPAHILTPSATVRRIVNMTAVAVVDVNAALAGRQ